MIGEALWNDDEGVESPKGMDVYPYTRIHERSRKDWMKIV